MNLHLTEQIAEVPPGLSITAGPPCNDTGACPAGVLIDGVFYLQSCGLIDPAAVSDQVYATGEGITAYVLDDVDPRVMLAWETTCEPPMDGRWHVLSAADRSRTPENEAAWCRVSLHGGDPAEGFDC